MPGVVDESPRLLPAFADEAATEEDEAAGSTGASRAASRRKGVACTAVALCTALLAMTLARRPTRAVGGAPAAEAVSLSLQVDALAGITDSPTIGVGNSIVKNDTGCTNWKQALFKTVTTPSANVCVEECREAQGCVAVNFQDEKCTKIPKNMHASQGACYLFSETCETGPNDCWNLYTLPVATATATTTLPMTTVTSTATTLTTAKVDPQSLFEEVADHIFGR